jgi:glycosyltransferase involved in cell wall biosynthesis
VKVSLCMIVKNEEKNLRKCLESVNSYVDEIVVIDTGSTDQTKEIARKYTDKIFDYAWCDDFAKARNYSLSKADNDWVLILDADEIILRFDKKSVYDFVQSNLKAVGRIKRINPFQGEKEENIYIERVNRLFNKKYYYYEGAIHEQVVAKDGSHYSMMPVEIEVDHIGYLDEVIGFTNKLERNIDLLLKSIKNCPTDPYLHYQIGKSYYKKKDFQKAYESFIKSISLCTNFRLEYVQDLIESYGYTLLKCGKYCEAMDLEKYQFYYGNSPDYNFVMALIYMNNGRFQEAVESFENCIGENEGKIEGVNSYLPNYNIGVIYEALGINESAIMYYQKCGGYQLARQRIKQIKSSMNN